MAVEGDLDRRWHRADRGVDELREMIELRRCQPTGVVVGLDAWCGHVEIELHEGEPGLNNALGLLGVRGRGVGRSPVAICLVVAGCRRAAAAARTHPPRLAPLEQRTQALE